MSTFIPVACPDLRGNERKYLLEAFDAGNISSKSPFVTRFEEAFADFCEVEHAISCANGTVALHLALVAMGIGEGDEVIVPACTFVATANAVLHAGARPVFVDVDSETWGMNPERVHDAVTPRTRAIIPVHLYGHPARMDEIVEAAGPDVQLIEDAAEAHGARYRGRRVGSLGRAATFSFFGNKTLTTGEGGAVTTDDAELAARMRQLRDHGADGVKQYWYPVVGYNYRMTGLQASIGLAQVERGESVLARKARIREIYGEGLSGQPVSFQPQAEWAVPSHWMITILVDGDACVDAEELRARLREHDVESRPVFPPLPPMPAFRDTASYPVSEDLARRGINLPSGPRIGDEDVRRVCDVLAAVLSK